MATTDTFTAPLITRPVAPESKKTFARPVLWWAALGLVFVGLNIYVFGRWLVDLPPTVSSGPTHVPGYMWWNIRAQEVIFPLLGALCFVLWVIVPVMKRQKARWDGIAIASFATITWQTYGVDWFNYYSGFNAVVINRGSWYEHVPFWVPPNTRGFPEAIVFDVGFFVCWILITIWYCMMMRAAKRRWPQLGKQGIFWFCVPLAMFMDAAMEFLWMRGGLYHYAGAIKGPWLIFQGHYYQIPMYEIISFGTCMAVVAAIRYFRNDKGESVAERGIDDVRIGAKSKTWVRFLALAGIFNLCYLVFNMVAVPFTMHGSDWPADIRKRSYFTAGVCGAKTNRVCPGPGVPLPLPGSPYMDHNGNLSHAPEGPGGSFTSPEWHGPPPQLEPFMK